MLTLRTAGLAATHRRNAEAGLHQEPPQKWMRLPEPPETVIHELFVL